MANNEDYNLKGAKVCLVSDSHDPFDDRIYHKQALSLVKAGYQVVRLSLWDDDADYISGDGIHIINIKKEVFYSSPFKDKFYRFFTRKGNGRDDLLKKAVDLNADVYHLHDLALNKIVKQLAINRPGAKLIYDVHEPYPELFRYAPVNSVVKKAILYIYSWYIYFWELNRSKHYHLIIATEPIVASKFKKANPSTRVETIYNYPAFKMNLDDAKDRVAKYDFIYSGGISRSRGVLEVLDALGISFFKPLKASPYSTVFVAHVL